MRTLLSGAALAIVCLFGWILGSLFPAPTSVLALLNPRAAEARIAGAIGGVKGDALLRSLSVEQQAAMEAAHHAAGALIAIERDGVFSAGADAPDNFTPPPATAPTVATAPSAPPQIVNATAPPPPQASARPTAAIALAPGLASPAPVRVLPAVSAVPGAHLLSDPTLASLSLCPGMTIHNAPSADGQGHVRGFVKVVNVNGVKLALDPAPGACLSSGFGQRGARPHFGIDYYSADGGTIHAAADGVILEMKYRDDYGNMLLIDHGGGVYTRYAHLASFRAGLSVGARVQQGDPIGLMGNTAAYPVPIHLHYELLEGNYANPKGSFGLDPHDPFGSLPRSVASARTVARRPVG